MSDGTVKAFSSLCLIIVISYLLLSIRGDLLLESAVDLPKVAIDVVDNCLRLVWMIFLEFEDCCPRKPKIAI